MKVKACRPEAVITINPSAKLFTEDLCRDKAKKIFNELGKRSILYRKSLHKRLEPHS